MIKIGNLYILMMVFQFINEYNNIKIYLNKIKNNGYHNFMKKIKFVITIIFLLIIYVYVVYITLIPSEIVLIEGEKLNFRNLFGIQKIETTKASNDNTNISNIEFKDIDENKVKRIGELNGY